MSRIDYDQVHPCTGPVTGAPSKDAASLVSRLERRGLRSGTLSGKVAYDSCRMKKCQPHRLR